MCGNHEVNHENIKGFVDDERVKLDERLIISSDITNIIVEYNHKNKAYVIYLKDSNDSVSGMVSFPAFLRDGALGKLLNTLIQIYGLRESKRSEKVYNYRTDVYKILFYLSKRGVSIQGFLLSHYKGISPEAKSFVHDLMFKSMLSSDNTGIRFKIAMDSPYYSTKADILSQLANGGDWVLDNVEYFPDGSYCTLGHALKHKYTVKETTTGEEIDFGIVCVYDFFDVNEELRSRLSVLHNSYLRNTLEYSILLANYDVSFSAIDLWQATFLQYLGVSSEVVNVIKKCAMLRVPIPTYIFETVRVKELSKSVVKKKLQEIEKIMGKEYGSSYSVAVVMGLMGYHSPWLVQSTKKSTANIYSLEAQPELLSLVKETLIPKMYKHYAKYKGELQQNVANLIKAISSGVNPLVKLTRTWTMLSDLTVDIKENVLYGGSNLALRYKGWELEFNPRKQVSLVALAENNEGNLDFNFVNYLKDNKIVDVDLLEFYEYITKSPANFKGDLEPDYTKVNSTLSLSAGKVNMDIINAFYPYATEENRIYLHKLSTWSFLASLKEQFVRKTCEKVTGISSEELETRRKAKVEFQNKKLTNVSDSSNLTNATDNGLTFDTLMGMIKDGRYLNLTFAKNFRKLDSEKLRLLATLITGIETNEFFTSLWETVCAYLKISDKQAIYLDKSIKNSVNKAKRNGDFKVVEEIASVLIDLL